MQPGDQLLGKVLFGFGPEQTSGCPGVFLYIRGEFDQALNVAADVILRLSAQGQFLMEKRRIQTEVNLDMAGRRCGVLFKLEPVDDGANE